MMAFANNPGKANQFILISIKESYSTKKEQKSRLTLVPLKGNTLNSFSAFPTAIYTSNGDNPYFLGCSQVRSTIYSIGYGSYVRIVSFFALFPKGTMTFRNDHYHNHYPYHYHYHYHYHCLL